MLEEITKRLDLLLTRYEGFQRLERKGSLIDQKVYEDLERNIKTGLGHLQVLKAKEYHQYEARYSRLMSGGDPL